MFRNPRENASLKSSAAILPSTGRPPTPPPTNGSSKSSPYFSDTPGSFKVKAPTNVSPVPILGRQPAYKPTSGKKNATKQNQSILSFFGKAEKSEEAIETAEIGLFFDDGKTELSPQKFHQTRPATHDVQEDDENMSRFNEDDTPVKRRRVDDQNPGTFLRTPSPDPDSITQAEEVNGIGSYASLVKPRKSKGGFIDDSSDEENDEATASMENTYFQANVIEKLSDRGRVNQSIVGELEGETTKEIDMRSIKLPLKPPDHSELEHANGQKRTASIPSVPALNREDTSMVAADDFDDEDFENDEFYEEGEEFLERRWMEEQRELEIGLDDDSKSESETEGVQTPGGLIDEELKCTPNENITLCPICNGSMKYLSENAASEHVNACLDGNAAPLPQQSDHYTDKPQEPCAPAPKFSGSAKRFQRAAIARPAQANPFAMAAAKQSSGTAFTKLMSGHAEDAAWAEAAANELQSRGKPAYQRTCPFYKIMPGLYICVDAFRYGKVEGQNAYFLSHFHSDHYVGLTSQWCHGPIYASKVTCNLMRQQLKVDSKWIHPLEFEKTIEVPNTKGVFVTMIPANHCPGSSLYLFEKVVGKNKDGTPKKNRILHCGDFRACPAHIRHPLLMPDVIDAVSGQVKQQIIDTCYLDTTYLTPKFSFPSQSDVIDACAQMCVSLSKEIIDSGDTWEKVKLAKAGSAMKKFLEDGKQEIVKDEEEVEVKPKVRGRLLVVIGTYSIGKERICLGIARALKSKIYAPPPKMRICKALEDADLNALLTSDPLDAQVHMQTLMEIRAETLHDYLITFKGHFHRVVGFRPTGWTYRPPTSRFTDNPAITTVLHSEGWKSRFTMHDLAPQRGSTKESNCFGVPYSEHSSFRELTMFCCALRINRIVPTVNVGSARSRERMKGWIEKWDAEKRKNGLFMVDSGSEGWGSGDGQLRYGV